MSLENSFYDAVSSALAQGRLNLPTLPDVALRVERLCREEDISASLLADQIARDPAIALRLMRVANSAAFGNNQRIDNLYQAIVRIGFSITRRLVSALAMEQMFNSEVPWLKELLQQQWTRSVEVAACSQALAQRYTQLNPAIAMLAGLVHDVGVLPIIRLAETQPQLRRGTVEEVIRSTAPRIGFLILRAWEFPPELAEVPAGCFDFARAHGGDADYVDVVSVAILHTSASGEPAPALAKLGISSGADVLDLKLLQPAIDEARRTFA